ncbi:DUF3618 domain-containing protein [Spongiactinospora sp. TRM90649]|uniref:DUF3618 domain-containing protein n=1 Tax=Spongiactinospora sp. TRM90649 TaxID=3031114 RepID=UPI0023FA3BA4|nr:DUF3618 domain-containing protein [Spongiactinospora sp. TRM90649]MDF5752627.1 DUF3618 domain-containing protein [Spongiactinospora sp. TRM90649]
MADIDPDELERTIERTRADLARTVDAIADRVSPKRVAERGVARARANAEHLLSTVSATVGDMVGLGGPPRPVYGPDAELPADGRSDDLWVDEDRVRELAPVLIGVGAVLVVGAAVWMWRRRRR